MLMNPLVNETEVEDTDHDGSILGGSSVEKCGESEGTWGAKFTSGDAINAAEFVSPSDGS